MANNAIQYRLFQLFPAILFLIICETGMAQEKLLQKVIFLESQSEPIGQILTQIEKEVEKEGELTFAYGNIVPSGKVVSISGGSKMIREHLDEIMQGIPVIYTERGNKIYLIRPATQTIRGSVKDVVTGASLIGANVIIEDSNPRKGATTDVNGHFVLQNVPVGRYNFEASYVGYQNKILFDEEVGSGKENFLDFCMREKFEEIAETEIHYTNRKCDPKNAMATVSARSFSVEETKRYPASINDPARMALIYPGVTVGDEDIFNELVIRGNTSSSVLWRIEGIEVPVPNHFARERNTTGWISMISSNLLGRSDFLTGAFPAEYGNALGGVFDLSLRNGNNRKNEYSFQVGMLGTDFTAEGPFSKNFNGSYLVNFRYNTTYAINRIIGLSEEGIIPRYWDLCYKVNLPSRKAGNFSIWGLGGEGHASNAGAGDADRVSKKTYSLLNTVGLTHLIMPDTNSYLKSSLAFSLNNSEYTEDDLLPVRSTREYEDFSLATLRFSILYRYKFSTKLSLKQGIILSLMNFDYRQQGYVPGRVNSSGNTNTIQAFIQGKYQLNTNLNLNAGLHFLYFGLNRNTILEPRLGMKWDFRDHQSIGIGIGSHSQVDYLSSYFQEVWQPDGTYTMPNKELGLAKAIHYVLAYNNSLLKNSNLKVELYYQDLYNLPVKEYPLYSKAPVNFEYPMDTLRNLGTGRNYGLEITAEKYFSRGYYFIISSSLYDSKIDPGNDTLYNTRYNAGWAQNAVVGKEFRVGRSKQDIIGINAKMIWTGGNRGQKYNADSTMSFTDRYEVQYSDYFRLDVNFIYRINRPRVSHIFSLDVQNLCNRNNIVRINFDFVRRVFITDHHEFGIFPFFSYRIEF